jgi:hypothetical protein
MMGGRTREGKGGRGRAREDEGGQGRTREDEGPEREENHIPKLESVASTHCLQRAAGSFCPLKMTSKNLKCSSLKAWEGRLEGGPEGPGGGRTRENEGGGGRTQEGSEPHTQTSISSIHTLPPESSWLLLSSQDDIEKLEMFISQVLGQQHRLVGKQLPPVEGLGE